MKRDKFKHVTEAAKTARKTKAVRPSIGPARTPSKNFSRDQAPTATGSAKTRGLPKGS
jgi:hypothetical protein